MTISTELTKIVYQGNGSTTFFPFSFPGGPNPDIHVFITDPDGLITELHTNFNVTINPPIQPNPTSASGSVIYPYLTGSPLPVGFKLTIERRVPYIQPTSLSNQAILYQEVVEAALDYIVMEVQQLKAEIDENIVFQIPPCPERANKFLAFDENCNPVAVGNSNPVVSSNAIRVPNTESIPELGQRSLRPGTIITFNGNGDPILAALPPPNLQALLGTRVTLTAVHNVVNNEKGFLFQLAGNAFYDLMLGNPTTYDTDFSIAVFNADIYTGPGTGRAKRILFNGTIMPGGLLWPGQWVYIFRYGATWVSNPSDQRWKAGTQVTFYVNPVLGHDDGTTDGLEETNGALLTPNFAVNVAQARLDYGGLGGFISGAIVQLAPGTYTQGVGINGPTVGGLPITLQGAPDGTPPGFYLISHPVSTVGVYVANSAALHVRGVSFESTGTNSEGISARYGSLVTINNCEFRGYPGGLGFPILIFDSSTANVSNCQFNGNCAVPIVVLRQSTARLSGTMTTGNGLSFGAWCAIQHHSSITGGPENFGDPGDLTLIGGAGCVGQKYQVIWNSNLDLGAGVADTLPGNAAGQTGTAVAHGVDASMVR